MSYAIVTGASAGIGKEIAIQLEAPVTIAYDI